MLIKGVKKLSPLDRLLYFIQERESIRLKKEAGEPAPWTDDEILRRYRFTCVRRMDDKVSRWLLENWYRPYKDHPNMVVACTLARQINQTSTLEEIGFPETWQPMKIIDKVRYLQGLGNRVFNPAYRILGKGADDAIEAVITKTVQPLVDSPPMVDPRLMQATWKALRGYYGLGSFIAGQVVADLRWAVTGGWYDRNRWAPMGPGSMRGMNRIHGRELEAHIDQDQFIEELLDLMAKCRPLLPETITKRLEAMDWQNVLCETDKNSRVLNNEGRPKQLYAGVG